VAEIQHGHTERDAGLQLGPIEAESIIAEDPEGALEASGETLHAGSIRIKVGPVGLWLAAERRCLMIAVGQYLSRPTYPASNKTADKS
jgi:hypothetical protein